MWVIIELNIFGSWLLWLFSLVPHYTPYDNRFSYAATCCCGALVKLSSEEMLPPPFLKKLECICVFSLG